MTSAFSALTVSLPFVFPISDYRLLMSNVPAEGSLSKTMSKMAFSHPAIIALSLLVMAACATFFYGQQKSVTIEGFVLDSACAFTKNLDKPISRECALACAKNGSQLVILSNDHSLYWPISDKTPAQGQNDRLVQFAGHRVRASGTLYERGGSHALVIEEIHEVSDQN